MGVRIHTTWGASGSEPGASGPTIGVGMVVGMPDQGDQLERDGALYLRADTIVPYDPTRHDLAVINDQCPNVQTHCTPHVSGTTSPTYAMCHNGETFVVVGYAGLLLTSQDGLVWEQRDSGTLRRLHSVAHNGSQWIAVGESGRACLSTDGVIWSESIINGSHLYGVVWDGAQWVVVGSNGTILTSADAVTWTSRSSGTLSTLYAVAYNGALLVAVGTNGTLLTSSDGVTWSARENPATSQLNGVVWSGGRFIAFGFDTLISLDGLVWNAATDQPSVVYAVIYTGSRFVAVGLSGRLWTSDDGMSWANGNSSVRATLRGVALVGGRLYFNGDSGTIISADAALSGAPVALYLGITPVAGYVNYMRIN